MKSVNPFAQTEVAGLRQPPPIRPPLRRVRDNLARGKKGAALAALRKDIRANKRAIAGYKRGAAQARKQAKAILRAHRQKVRALKQQIRALRAANPNSVYNKAKGGARVSGRRGGRGRGGLLLWAVRKAMRLMRGRGGSDFRNHGATGVRQGSGGLTGRAGR